MIGPWLLAAAAAKDSQTERDVYLPEGDWIDYHNLAWIHSRGETLSSVALYTSDGRYQLPLYAKAGAILPLSLVDDQTMNILGQRLHGPPSTDLKLRVFADAKPSQFHLYEDDNFSEAYQTGAYRETVISQEDLGHSEKITVNAAKGNYTGAPGSRKIELEFVKENACVQGVLLNSNALKKLSGAKPQPGWYQDPRGVVVVQTSGLPVFENQVFEIIYCP